MKGDLQNKTVSVMASATLRSKSIVTDRLDTVLDDIGFGLFHVAMILRLGCRMLLRGTSTGMSVILEPYFQCEFELSHIVASMYLLVSLISNAILSWPAGWMADKYGKRRTMILLNAMMITSGILQISSSSFALIVATTVAEGFSHCGQNLIYSYLLETSSKSKRHISSLFEIFFIFGFTVAVPICDLCLKYLSWRWCVVFCIILPAVLSMLTLIDLPESPRYLLMVGNKTATLDALVKMAKMNKCGRDENENRDRFRKMLFEEKCEVEDVKNSFSDDFPLVEKGEESMTVTTESVWRRVIMVSLITFLNQLFRATLTYGSGQQYKKDELSAACGKCIYSLQIQELLSVSGGQAASLVLTYHFLRRFKRRFALRFLITSLALVVFPFHFQITKSALSVCFFVTCAITEALNVVIAVYMSEVVPTSVRGVAVGTVSASFMSGGFGGVLFSMYLLHLNGTITLIILHGLILTCLFIIYYFAVETKESSLN